MEGNEMKKILGFLLLILVTGLMLAGCSTTDRKEAKSEIVVSAAASLRNAMDEIKTVYEEKNTGIKITFNFGSSGSLQTQIEQGAPADLFLSAGKSQMDALEQKNLLTSATRIDLVSNDLVLVVDLDNNDIKSFQDLAKAQKIGIGTPESVPAGKYAKEALKNMKLWDSLESQSKFVQAKDVTQVLTYVETNNVEAGLVYLSDAHESDKVKVVAAAPTDSHSPIIYPAAVIAASQNQTEAKTFLDYLGGADAQAIFAKYGFKAK
jgi:molybdate transport system substrate-binding protein